MHGNVGKFSLARLKFFLNGEPLHIRSIVFDVTGDIPLCDCEGHHEVLLIAAAPYFGVVEDERIGANVNVWVVPIKKVLELDVSECDGCEDDGC